MVKSVRNGRNNDRKPLTGQGCFLGVHDDASRVQPSGLALLSHLCRGSSAGTWEYEHLQLGTVIMPRGHDTDDWAGLASGCDREMCQGAREFPMRSFWKFPGVSRDTKGCVYSLRAGMGVVSTLYLWSHSQLCGSPDRPTAPTHLPATTTRAPRILTPRISFMNVLLANAKPPPVVLNFFIGSGRKTPLDPHITLISAVTANPPFPTHTIPALTPIPPARVRRDNGSPNHGDNQNQFIRPSSADGVREIGPENTPPSNTG